MPKRRVQTYVKYPAAAAAIYVTTFFGTAPLTKLPAVAGDTNMVQFVYGFKRKYHAMVALPLQLQLVLQLVRDEWSAWLANFFDSL